MRDGFERERERERVEERESRVGSREGQRERDGGVGMNIIREGEMVKKREGMCV